MIHRKSHVRGLLSAVRRGAAVGAGIALIAQFPLPRPLAAEESADPDSAAARFASAARVSRGALQIDGRLEEGAWREAKYTTGFFQKEPTEGRPSTRRTEVAFLYDKEALYVGARMWCDPEEILSTMARRDNTGNSERIIITLDTYRDRRTSYSFGVTAGGVRTDYYHALDEEGSRDFSFDPVWEARTRVNGKNWTAEMRIPFSQLRFNDGHEIVFGLNMNHWMPSRNEDAYWVLIPKQETGWASRFGELRGIQGIPSSRRVEITPYFAGDVQRAGDGDGDDPFYQKTDSEWRTGADLKMGLGPNLTLEGTINPDFGQVEADPAEVNLTAYETYFEERRSFFIEGRQLLEGERPYYYYSRRIGATPHGDVDGDYVRTPSNTTILGASKLSGRLSRGLSVAGLAAITGKEHAQSYDESTAAIMRVRVEPVTGYGILRLQQEFGADRSTAGVTMTGVHRDLSGAPHLAAQLVRNATSGGADCRLRFRGGEYMARAAVGFSRVEGDPSALREVQESSVHYFQRPDATHVSLDTTKSALDGYTYYLSLHRTGGEHWLWGMGTCGESPGFETNDLGQLGAADDREVFANLQYRETKPKGPFRNYWMGAYGGGEWNFGGVRQSSYAELDLSCTWKNHWSSWCGYWRGWQSTSDALTRGGPLMKTFDVWSAWAGLNNNWASNTRFQTNLNYSENEAGAYLIGTSFYFSLRAGGRWEFSVDPSYNFHRSARQYVDALGDGREETFGKRSIFSWIDQSTLSARFRLNYALTPDLTLELYAEPFASSGRYYDYGELEAPRSQNLITYGRDGGTTVTVDNEGVRTVTFGDAEFEIENNDFNVLSFRSNAVLRWEWRRGSALYLVWQQNRSEDEAEGSLVGGRDLWSSLRSEGENFFALKVTYWIPLS